MSLHVPVGVATQAEQIQKHTSMGQGVMSPQGDTQVMMYQRIVRLKPIEFY